MREDEAQANQSTQRWAKTRPRNVQEGPEELVETVRERKGSGMMPGVMAESADGASPKGGPHQKCSVRGLGSLPEENLQGYNTLTAEAGKE